MKQKTRIIIYIAIAITALALGIIAILSMPKETAPQTATEFLNAGNKYLIELSYDKAVIEFNKAIEIEPRNADAYIGLAEAYIGMEDKDKAIETLELGYENTGDERIKEMLDELIGEDEVTTVTTTEVTVTTIEAATTVSETGTFIDEMIEIGIPFAFYDGSNAEYEYGFMENIYTDKGYEINVQSYDTMYCTITYTPIDELPFEVDGSCDGPISIGVSRYNDSFHYSFNCDNDNKDWGTCEYPEFTQYNENGDITEQAENEYDSENKLVKSTVYDSDNNVIRVKEFVYDENGLLNCVMENDKLRSENFYDDNGNKIKNILYTSDGEENYIAEWEYDSNNNCVSRVSTNIIYPSKSEWKWEYDSSGNILKETYNDITNAHSNTTIYDSNGNEIEFISDNVHNKYEYDLAGRKIKEYSNHGDDDEWDSIFTYRYNSDGVLYEYDFESIHGGKETIPYDPNTQHTVSDKIKYMKIALPSIFVEQIKNEYGIDLAA